MMLKIIFVIITDVSEINKENIMQITWVKLLF